MTTDRWDKKIAALQSGSMVSLRLGLESHGNPHCLALGAWQIKPLALSEQLARLTLVDCPGFRAQGRKPFALHRAMALPDATRTQRKMLWLGRLPARQRQLNGASLRDLFAPGTVVAHCIDTKLGWW